jgi:hypothetical protein
MDQVSVNYTNIFHCKALQNLLKFGFFGLKTNHLATRSTFQSLNNLAAVKGFANSYQDL